MASNFAPIVDRIRILPRRSEFLGRNIGVVGEVYYDNTTNTLRIYDGKQQGGFSLAKSDLSNVSDADFLSKASSAGAGGGGASIAVSDTAPESPSEGSIWFNNETSSLSVYVGTQWVAPIPTSVGSLAELQMARGVAIAEFSTDAGLTDASTDTVPTESAVKGYVDTQIASLTGLPASVVIQDDAPTLPQSGDLWWESSTGRLKIYYDDGTSSQWVDATPPLGNNIGTFEPAIAVLRVANNSTTAYTFNSHYSGDNPNLYAISGTTIAFDLSNISGHPFEIQNSLGNQFNTGLVHVASNGLVSLGQAAQGKDSGTLYWRIPESISGVYGYQCQIHSGMAGSITVKRLSLI